MTPISGEPRVVLTADDVHALLAALGSLGYDDIVWTESLGLPADADVFAFELIFVIVNSGMRFTVARGIFERIRIALLAGRSAATAFNHAGKKAAIDALWHNRALEFERFLAAADKIEHLGRLPWIGPITKHHAARNCGVDTIKPDLHLARLADAHRTTPFEMCRRLATDTGLRIGSIDAILWRASAMGLLDSRTGIVQLHRIEHAQAICEREMRAIALRNARQQAGSS